MRRVLGSHVQQAGSFVSERYLRFDFNHFNKLDEIQLKDIESMVNGKIREGHDVLTEELKIEQARKIPNVKMFFGDKYGSKVRVVTIDPNYSVEFCGGTHVKRSSEIGFVKIILETSVQSGVRRLEAITGEYSDQLLLDRFKLIDTLNKKFHSHDNELLNKIENLSLEVKKLFRENTELKNNFASNDLTDIINNGSLRSGIKLSLIHISEPTRPY